MACQVQDVGGIILSIFQFDNNFLKFVLVHALGLLPELIFSLFHISLSCINLDMLF